MADKRNINLRKAAKEGFVEIEKKREVAKEKGYITNFRQVRPPVDKTGANRVPTHIFINATSALAFQAQLAKVLSLFESGVEEVTVQALGRAVPTAANLCLQVVEKLSNTVEISVSTSSVAVPDTWEPVNDDLMPFLEERTTSALHIVIRRIPAFPTSN